MDVLIDGQGPYSFILDTGAREGLIDAELVLDLQLRVTGVDTLFDGVTHIPTYMITVDEVALGAFRRQDVPFAAAPVRQWFASDFYGYHVRRNVRFGRGVRTREKQKDSSLCSV